MKVIGSVDSLCYSPDDSIIGVAASNLTGAYWSGQITLLNKGEEEQQHTYNTTTGNTALQCDRIVETLLQNTHDDIVSCIDVSRNKKALVTGSWDKCVRLWSLEDLKQVRSYSVHDTRVHAVSWQGDDEYTCASSSSTRVVVADLRSTQTFRTIKCANGPVLSMCWTSPTTIYCGLENGSIALLDTRNTLSFAATHNIHSRSVNSIKVNPHDANQLATVSDDRSLKLFDIQHSRITTTIESSSGSPLRSLDWNKSTKGELVTGSFDSTKKIDEVLVNGGRKRQIDRLNINRHLSRQR
eukprot:gene13616-16023_t